MGLVMSKVYQVIERIDYDFDETLGIFSTREKALEYLSGRKKTIFHHVATIERDDMTMRYDTWNMFVSNHYPSFFGSNVIESVDVGVTEGNDGIGYRAPDGRLVEYDTLRYLIEEYELDEGKA